MRILLLLFIAVITLVHVPNVFAQPRQITEAELKKLISDSAEKRKGMSYVQKRSTTGYNAGDSSDDLFEFGPNDTYHYRLLRKQNGTEIKYEGIRIGTVRYTLQQDGNWLKDIPKSQGSAGYGAGSGSGSGAGPSVPPEITQEYRYVGSEKMQGQLTSHYRKTEVVRFNSPTALTRRVVDDYWFNSDGLLLKESRDDKFENSERRYTSVTEYEYRKDIKITPPIPD